MASNTVLSSDHEYATVSADETCHNELVARTVTLTPCSHTPVIATRTCSGLLIIKPKTVRFSHASLQVVRGIDAVTLGQPSNVILTDLPEKQVFMQKHVIIAQTLDRPQLVSPTVVTFLESGLDTVAAVHYKPSVDRYM